LVNRATLEEAFILHTRSFKETSLIVDAFTQNYGKMSFVAKGAKRPKSSLRVIQTPTTVFSISFTGKSDLKTLTQCEIIEHFRISSKVALSCIIYLNELLTKTLEKEDPHPEIFNQFKMLCHNLSKDQNQESIELQLRSFELILLQELGYGIDLENEALSGIPINVNSSYSFDPALGFTKIGESEVGLAAGGFLGKDILSFAKGDLANTGSRNASKKIMRRALDFHLGNKTLNIRKYLIESGAQ
jgi:DNA repair protein RecO (recombination protein O)